MTLAAPSRRTFRTGLLALITLLVGIVVLAGCSGSDSSSKGSAGQDGAAVDGSTREYGPAAAPTPGGGTASSQGTTTDQITAAAADRAVIRTAEISTRAGDIDRAADQIIALANQPGERVDGDQRSRSGRDRTAVVTLRVVPYRLDSVLAAIHGLGSEVSRSVHGQDVTATQADLDARVTALATSVDRLRGFLANSGTVADLVTLEKELSSRQAELDGLRAQQRALSDQVALAMVTATVITEQAPVPVARDHGPTGFGSAVSSGWHGLVVGWRFAIAGLGYALPIALLGAVVIGGSVLLRRRWAATRPGPARAVFAGAYPGVAPAAEPIAPSDPTSAPGPVDAAESAGDSGAPDQRGGE